MAEYCVQVMEVYRQDTLVDAENEEQAVKKVADGEGIQQESHYDYTLEPDAWFVFKIL